MYIVYIGMYSILCTYNCILISCKDCLFKPCTYMYVQTYLIVFELYGRLTRDLLTLTL